MVATVNASGGDGSCILGAHEKSAQATRDQSLGSGGASLGSPGGGKWSSLSSTARGSVSAGSAGSTAGAAAATGLAAGAGMGGGVKVVSAGGVSGNGCPNRGVGFSGVGPS